MADGDDEPAAEPVRLLGRELDALRRARGLSYRQLERRSDVAASTLQYWLTRSTKLIPWSQLRPVIRALGEPDEVWLNRWRAADRALARTGTASRGVGKLVTARAQLPMDIGEFVGRRAELRRIHATWSAPVLVITGMAGVGKTRLAIRAAHQLSKVDQGPEVQLYADLRGRRLDQHPATAGEVLGAFLGLLGVAARDIPPGLADRAALYRHRLAGRRAVVVLDDAADEDRLRPLVSSVGAESRILVTSRRRLRLDGARELRLTPFEDADAVAQLVAVIGAGRAAEEASVAADIVRWCSGLPLAVALAARRLRARPAWRLKDFAGRLRSEAGRLTELAVGGRDLRAALAASYQRLPDRHREVFHSLGHHARPEVTPGSLAHLTGLSADTAEHSLTALRDEHLVDRTRTGSYRIHELVHLYAKELGAADVQ